jgi:protein-tyrosine phosphatase
MTGGRAAKRTAPRKPKSTASEIEPGFFVGGWKDAEAFTGSRFCVLDTAPEDMPPATHVPIYDDATRRPLVANLDRLATMIAEARARDEPVLVFCGHGVRRAPLAGAWYLHRAHGLSLDDSYARIRAARPGVEHVQEWAEGWAVLDPGAGGERPPRRTL